MAEEDLILNVIEKTTGNALGDGADDLDRLGDSADRAGGSFRDLGNDTGFIDAEIGRLKTHIHDLGTEIDRTGNTSLFKDLKKDKSQLRQLESLSKSLRPVGESWGKEFLNGFMGPFSGGGLSGALIPVVGTIAVGLAPMIGAVIGAAVTGAVGLGGIAGGIAMASKDSGVRQAAHLFGQDISKEFFSGGDAFIQPVQEALSTLGDAVKSADLGAALAPLAAAIEPLAHGLSGFIGELMPGLRAAFAGAVPIMEEFAKILPDIGEALGGMLADIVNSQGALTAMRTLGAAVTLTLEALGKTIQFLTTTWDGMVRGLAAVTGFFEDFPAVVSPAISIMSTLNDGFEELAGIAPRIDGAWSPIPGRFQTTAGAIDTTTYSTSNLTMSINDLKTALDDLFEKQMSYDQAILAVQKDTLALTTAVKNGTASLNTHTAAGLANKEMILRLIKDYENQRDASIKMGMSTAEATRKFDSQVAALGRLLSKLGFSKSEINNLLGAYKRLHDAPNIQKEIRIHVSTTGATGALSLMGNVGKVAAFAEGGWVKGPPGKPQLAVVHGGEFVLSHDMLKNSAMPRTSAPGVAAATSSRVEAVWVAPPGVVEDAIGEIVRRFVHFRGGDPVAALAS